ncbi:hypothetical protein [Brunnivagina elsteri]|uniref:hypothetical protein n=1 Tax=Brunnivagina elsteri TaxID=1247191 RepID=UPI00117881A3|nr:hypothetical protein [Calothrix elsteri]
MLQTPFSQDLEDAIARFLTKPNRLTTYSPSTVGFQVIFLQEICKRVKFSRVEVYHNREAAIYL